MRYVEDLADQRPAFCGACTGCFILLDFSGSRCLCLRRFEDNLPPAENNQQPSASWADCNETGIYFLFPPSVAALRHDWAYVELFTAPAVEGEEKKQKQPTTCGLLPAGMRLEGGGDAVRLETEEVPTWRL